MAPVVHGLESEYAGRIGFAYIDVDDSAGNWLQQELGYRVQPHLFLLDSDGDVVEQWIGFTSKEKLIISFDAILAADAVQ